MSHGLIFNFLSLQVKLKCERPECKWNDSKKKLVRHIGQSKICKQYYGPRYDEMLKDSRKATYKVYADKRRAKTKEQTSETGEEKELEQNNQMSLGIKEVVSTVGP